MTRRILFLLEWIASAVFAACVYLTWARDVRLPAPDVRPGCYYLTGCAALALGLWARAIAASHHEGRGFDRALRMLRLPREDAHG